MVQGGTTNPTNLDAFIENVVIYISKKEDLLQELQDLLKLRGFEKKGENFDKSAINKFLMENTDVFGDIIDLVLENFEKNKVESKEFLEQENKVKGMEKELETLGNQLLAQGLISGAAVTTLTGALAGLLTVGGVTGALIIGGAALIGFVALVAIAVIGYAIYQHRGEIKEGAIEAGKAVKSFVKDVIDKLPIIQARENNFDRLRSKLLAGIADDSKLKTGQSMEKAKELNKIVEMLQNQKQKSAIQELVKNGTIENFSEADMIILLEKGLSTHLDDQKPFDDLIDQFQPAIMAIGSDIKDVEQKVNDKVKEIYPDTQLDGSISTQGTEKGKGKG
ncbi:glycine zipper family protein [Wolbachia pipientis]|uniref:glycine zipper family protein n=1 Tax=Wolbachia pipientis TaxID=955 RepID=UPI001BDA8DED|nr:glycine zipper family protein [Wolbachia pipientis]UIP92200.1 glycine zipper family protein [Wolbachia pipientis]